MYEPVFFSFEDVCQTKTLQAKLTAVSLDIDRPHRTLTLSNAKLNNLSILNGTSSSSRVKSSRF